MSDDIPEINVTPKLDNERARLTPVMMNEYGCKDCKYFIPLSTCEIVEGPVSVELTCDWLEYTYNDDHEDDCVCKQQLEVEDEQAFLWEILKNQPQQSEVKDIADTPVGWLLLFRDKVGKYWSKSLGDFLEAVNKKHHWMQELVDGIVREGKMIKVKPPTSEEEASKQFGDGDMSLREFDKFRGK